MDHIKSPWLSMSKQHKILACATALAFVIYVVINLLQLPVFRIAAPSVQSQQWQQLLTMIVTLGLTFSSSYLIAIAPLKNASAQRLAAGQLLLLLALSKAGVIIFWGSHTGEQFQFISLISLVTGAAIIAYYHSRRRWPAYLPYLMVIVLLVLFSILFSQMQAISPAAVGVFCSFTTSLFFLLGTGYYGFQFFRRRSTDSIVFACSGIILALPGLTWAGVSANGIDWLLAQVLTLIGATIPVVLRSDTASRLERISSQRRIMDLALDISKLGVWTSDSLTGGLEFDQRMRELYGIAPNARIDQKSANKKIIAEDKVFLDELCQEAMRDGKLKKFQYRLKMDDGQIKTVDGNLICVNDPKRPGNTLFVGLNKDVTKKVATTQMNNRLLDILDSTTDFISHGNDQGVAEYFNKSFASLISYDESETIMIKDLHPQWANEIIGEVGIPTAIESGAWHGETAVLNAAGEEVPVSQVIISHKDQDGKLIYLSTIMRDNRDQKRLLATLESQKSEVEAAFNARSTFLANMSHEIRTPLNGILGLLEQLRDDITEPRDIERLEMIEASGDLLLSIVNDVLDLTKIEAGKLELEKNAVNLKKVIDSVVSMVASKARSMNTSVVVKIDKTIPAQVIGDSFRLQQILINLVGNAVKFCKDGEVMIAVRPAENRDPESYLFQIVDNGIGIASENLPKLFSKFEQADKSTTRKFGGTGLGLSICKALVDLWGGKIWVVSELGEGTEFNFEISLPKAVKQSVVERDRIMPEIDPNIRILVAEDNSLNQTVLKANLRKLGLKADYAADGVEAVQKSMEKIYDLILMDCHMPNLDGYEATQRIKAHYKSEAPVIIALTASAMAEDKARCKESGMDDFLSKPLKRADLAIGIARNFSKRKLRKTS